MAGFPPGRRAASAGGRRGKDPLSAVLVFGTGAMACLFAARLARAGHGVTLAGTWPRALETVSKHGVSVESTEGSFSVDVAAMSLAGPLPDAALRLVLVKSHQTQSVAPHVARGLASQAFVVTLQNGFGNREALEASVGPGRVSIGVTVAGATLLGPGRVRGHIGPTTLADDRGGRACAELLRSAGLEVAVTRDIDQLLWRKLAVNCAINALTALHRVENGRLLEDPALRGEMEQAAREAGRVAAAAGVRLQGDPAELAAAVASATAGNKSSMLQDVERGAATEIEAINGAVVREAHRLGVGAPVNERLLAAVRDLAPHATRAPV